MATKKTIELEVNTNAEQAKKGIDDLGQSVDNLNQAEKKVQKTNKDLHASFEEVYGEVKPLTAQMGEMEDRLYEMAKAGDTTSKEFNDLVTEVGRYRKIQIDTDMVVDAAATTMAQKLGGAIQGAASGFALVQGSMALFGTESEALEETLLKVQSAMAITQGIEGLREGAKSFKAMGMAAKAALGGIRKGLIATGIGAAVVALGLMVAYWDDIVKATKKLLGETDSLNDKYEQGEIILEAQKKTTERKIRLMEAEGATAEEIHKVKLSMIDAEINQSKIAIQRAEAQKKTDIEAAKRNQLILETILAWMFGPLDMLLKAYNKIASMFKLSQVPTLSETVAKEVFNIEKTAGKADEAIKEANDNLKALQDERKILTATFNKQQVADAKSSRDRAKARKEALIAIERELFDKRIALREETEQKEIDLAKETNRRELQDLKKRRKNGELSFLQFQQFRIVAQNKLNKDLKDINDKYRAEELEAEKAHQDNLKNLKNEFLNELEAETEIANKRLMSEQEFEIQIVEDKYFRLIELAKQYGEDTSTLEANRTAAIKDINDKFRKEEEEANKTSNDKKKENDLALQNAKFEMANNTLNLIGSINELFNAENEEQSKRNFQIDKAVKIAQATSSGIQATINAFATASKSPITIGFPAYPFIQAGLAGSFAAVNVAKIAKTKFGGGGASEVDTGGGGAGGGGGGSMPQPSFNVVGDSGINQLAELQMQPTQAFVVSGDITTAQSLDRNKIQNATI